MSNDDNEKDDGDSEEKPELTVHQISGRDVNGLLQALLQSATRGAPADTESEMGEALREKEELGPMADLRVYTQAEILREAYRIYATHHAFEPGQLVRIKRFFDNTRIVRINQPLIIIDVFKEPIFNDHLEKHHSSSFGEILDVRVGLVQPKCEIILFPWDSRELEPYVIESPLDEKS